MSGIRQIEIHAIPIVFLFFKRILNKDVSLNFGRIERNVMESPINIRFEPKRLARNQLPSKIHVILNCKSTGCHESALITNINHGFPVYILCRIKQQITCINRISSYCRLF